MSEELTLESLNLKKPLDKMTAKELRQLVMEKIPGITGASGMDKEQLIAAIKEALGIEDQGEGGASPYKDQIHSLKREIRSLREQKESLSTRREREHLRRRINKLKKRTRRLARAT
jgi:FtsZ-binding cell division protein ZapB